MRDDLLQRIQESFELGKRVGTRAVKLAHSADISDEKLGELFHAIERHCQEAERLAIEAEDYDDDLSDLGETLGDFWSDISEGVASALVERRKAAIKPPA